MWRAGPGTHVVRISDFDLVLEVTSAGDYGALCDALGSSWIAIQLLIRSMRATCGIANQLYASLMIGAAICGMHYVGMYAVMLRPNTFCQAGRDETSARMRQSSDTFASTGLKPLRDDFSPRT